ncbi:MAG: hypothetical protein IJK98_02275 [Clostridia bacterium]|nr:hypothetical protein [Clostridia bacterium]
MLFYDVTQIAEVTRNGSLSDESDTASGNPGTNNIPQASGNVNAESVKDSLRLTGLTRLRASRESTLPKGEGKLGCAFVSLFGAGNGAFLSDPCKAEQIIQRAQSPTANVQRPCPPLLGRGDRAPQARGG